jgi:hypothetical protein
MRRDHLDKRVEHRMIERGEAGDYAVGLADSKIHNTFGCHESFAFNLTQQARIEICDIRHPVDVGPHASNWIAAVDRVQQPKIVRVVAKYLRQALDDRRPLVRRGFAPAAESAVGRLYGGIHVLHTRISDLTERFLGAWTVNFNRAP